MPLAYLGLALAWTVMLLFGGTELDRNLLTLGYAGDRPEIARFAGWLTEIGGWRVLLPITAAGAALLVARRDWRGAVVLVALTISGRLMVELQKDWTARLRPQEHEHLVAVQSLAFPSGHAANTTMVALGLALLLTQSGRGRAAAVWAAVWLALAVGASRVLLGVHWPSDVVAGWAFGLVWTFLFLRLSGRGPDEGTGRPLRH
jgi:membrane-associated phospholipid phosphatase